MPISKRNRSIRRMKSKKSRKSRKASNPKRTRRKSRRVKRSRKMRGGAKVGINAGLAALTTPRSPPRGYGPGEAGDTVAAGGIPLDDSPLALQDKIPEIRPPQPAPEPEPAAADMGPKMEEARPPLNYQLLAPYPRADTKGNRERGMNPGPVLPSDWHVVGDLTARAAGPIKLKKEMVYEDSDGNRSIEIEIGKDQRLEGPGLRTSSQKHSKQCFAFTVPLSTDDRPNDEIRVTLPDSVYTTRLYDLLRGGEPFTVVTPDMMRKKNGEMRPLDPTRIHLTGNNATAARRANQSIIPPTLNQPPPTMLSAPMGTQVSNQMAMQPAPASFNLATAPSATEIAEAAAAGYSARPDDRNWLARAFGKKQAREELLETPTAQSERILGGEGGEKQRCDEIDLQTNEINAMMDYFAQEASIKGIALDEMLSKDPDVEKMYREFEQKLQDLTAEKREYETRAAARLECLESIKIRLNDIIDQHQAQYQQGVAASGAASGGLGAAAAAAPFSAASGGRPGAAATPVLPSAIPMSTMAAIQPARAVGAPLPLALLPPPGLAPPAGLANRLLGNIPEGGELPPTPRAPPAALGGDGDGTQPAASFVFGPVSGEARTPVAGGYPQPSPAEAHEIAESL